MHEEFNTEQKANARLIAQAPELYAFAKEFLELFRDSDMYPEDECHELYTKAYNVIKKVRGEA